MTIKPDVTETNIKPYITKMKVTVKAAILMKALFIPFKLFKKMAKGGDAAYTTVLLEFDDGNLYCYSTDGNINAKSTYGPVDDCSDAFYLVDFDSLNSVVTHSYSEDVVLDFQEARLVIKDQKSIYQFQYFISAYMPHKSLFDMTATRERKPIVNFTSAEFSEIIQFLDPNINKDVARMHLTGVKYYKGKFLASNGSTLFGCVSYNTSETETFVAKNSLDLITAIDALNNCEVYERGSVIEVTSERATILMPQVEDKDLFKHIEVLEKVNFDYSYVFDRVRIYKALKKIQPFADSIFRNRAYIILNTEGYIEIHVETDKSRSGVDEVPFLDTSTPSADMIERVLPINVLADSIGAMCSDTISINIPSKDSTKISVTDESGRAHYLGVQVKTIQLGTEAPQAKIKAPLTRKII